MPIFRRITDILTANVNDLVDRIEDPEALLRQAVRDLETAVGQTMNAAARSIANERLLARQIEEQRRQGADLHVKAREALARQDEDRARALLVDRRRYDEFAAALDVQLEGMRSQNARLHRRLDALRLRLSEMRQSVQLHIASSRLVNTERSLALNASWTNGSFESANRFDRLRDRIKRAEEESLAWLELAGERPYDEAAGDAEIERQLAELQAALAAAS